MPQNKNHPWRRLPLFLFTTFAIFVFAFSLSPRMAFADTCTDTCDTNADACMDPCIAEQVECEIACLDNATCLGDCSTDGLTCIGPCEDDYVACDANCTTTAATATTTAPTVQPLPNPLNTEDGLAIVGNILQTMLSILGASALLMFIYGGFLWIFSGGEEEKIKKGRQTVVWAVLGMVAILTSYSIFNFLYNLFNKL